jgi:ribosomal protein S18 acetylase RimI-like enzyme
MVDGVRYRNFEDADLEWTLLAMVASMRATMTPERSAAKDDRAMLEEARADLDRYHYRSGGADKLIVALRDGERIGMVWVTMEQLHQDPGSAWLLEVFVDPRYRRQGLARELMDRAEQWAREKGAAEMWLNVGGGNTNALGLYRSQGYSVETMHLSKRL